jgi:hypothetical protein
VERAWNVRGKLEGVGVESAWVWAWKVRGKLRGYVGVERSWKVRGCEQKEGWVRWYYRDR